MPLGTRRPGLPPGRAPARAACGAYRGRPLARGRTRGPLRCGCGGCGGCGGLGPAALAPTRRWSLRGRLRRCRLIPLARFLPPSLPLAAPTIPLNRSGIVAAELVGRRLQPLIRRTQVPLRVGEPVFALSHVSPPDSSRAGVLPPASLDRRARPPARFSPPFASSAARRRSPRVHREARTAPRRTLG